MTDKKPKFDHAHRLLWLAAGVGGASLVALIALLLQTDVGM